MVRDRKSADFYLSTELSQEKILCQAVLHSNIQQCLRTFLSSTMEKPGKFHLISPSDHSVVAPVGRGYC